MLLTRTAMKPILHITNGDSAADIIGVCGLGGNVLPWRDPMHHGPFLPGLSLDEISRVRIDYLNGALSSPYESVHSLGQHGFSERDAILASAPEYKEVVLWFEHDLLDQLQLLQLLDWFGRNGKFDFKLSLICIDHFKGVTNFRGIGQLTPEQMATLFSSRQPVTQTLMELASTYWVAYCSTEPQALLQLLKAKSPNDDKTLPFLSAALARHCQEFPWISDGLTRTERQLLKLVASGVTKPKRVFIDNMECETCLYVGDWRTYSQIAQLCESTQPLLSCVSAEEFSHPYNSSLTGREFDDQQLCITEFGMRVLEGEVSAADTLVRNMWLGGVHLNNESQMWFWDDQKQQFSYA